MANGDPDNPAAVMERALQRQPPTQPSPRSAPDVVPTADPADAMQRALQGQRLTDLPLERKPAPGQRTGPFANIVAGGGEKAAEFLGAPVDIAAWGLRPPAYLQKDVPGLTFRNPIGGSDWWKTAFGSAFGSGADPRSVVPANETERILRAVGGGGTSMFLPGAAMRTLRGAGALPEAIGAGATPAGVTAGAVGAGTGQAAQDVVPAPYKPYADLAGNLLGGGLVAGGEAAVKAAANRVGPLARDFFRLLTHAGQQQRAGQIIARTATDPAMVQQRLASMSGEPIPDFPPTSYQVTEDPGIGGLERYARTKEPARYQAQLELQHQAQVAAVKKLAPTGSPDDTVNLFKSQQARSDQVMNAAIDLARQDAEQAATGLGGVPAGVSDARSARQAYGQSLRGGILDAHNQDQRRISGLYDAVDPNGTLMVGAGPVRDGADAIVRDMPSTAAPLEGENRRIFDTARNLPDDLSFRDTSALRSRITTAMRVERMANGASDTWHRLDSLRQRIDDTLNNGLGDRAGQDNAAVQRGQMSPDETTAAKINAWRDEWRARQAGGGSAAGAGPGTPGPVGGPPGVSGSQGQGLRGPGGPQGAGAVETTPATVTPFDEEAAARYRLANQQYAQHVATFHTPPGVGDILQGGARAGEWKLGDGEVAGAIFRSGPQAAQRVQSFLRAGGNSAALSSDLQDYAAFSLKQAADPQNTGILDPARADRWIAQHSEALNQFPALRARMQDASQRAAMVQDAVARHAQAQRDFADSAAAKLLGTNDPAGTIGRILRSGTNVDQMQELARRTALDPSARQGLKRGVVDYIMSGLRSATPAGGGTEGFKLQQFQDFVDHAEPALRTIFSPDEIASLKATAETMRSQQLSLSGAKVPGGPGTAQDIAAVASQEHPTGLSTLLAAEGAGELGHLVSGHPAVAAVMRIGVILRNAIQQAGYRNVEQYLRDAAFDPGTMKFLLSKVPMAPTAQTNYAKLLGQRITALAANSAMRSMSPEPETPEPPPPTRRAISIPSPAAAAPVAAPFSLAVPGL